MVGLCNGLDHSRSPDVVKFMTVVDGGDNDEGGNDSCGSSSFTMFHFLYCGTNIENKCKQNPI